MDYSNNKLCDLYDKCILVGDIGGTETTIGIIGTKNNEFFLAFKNIYKSNTLESIESVLSSVLEEVHKIDSRLIPDSCCIACAGMIYNNKCDLTNLDCSINGNSIEKYLGIKTTLINDFTALGYSIKLLDHNNPAQIKEIPHLDGSFPPKCGNLSLIIGAGTALGISFIVDFQGNHNVFVTEGGSATFPAFDEETKELKFFLSEYLSSNYPMEIGNILSGRGITNIFHYFKTIRQIPMKGILKDIDNAPDLDKPGLISFHAESDQTCNDIVKLFVKIYGRITADFSTLFLPSMGVYLAGGIIVKNELFFLRNNQFVKYFEQGFHPNIVKFFKSIPLFIIRDTNASLYGAAFAGLRTLD